MSGAQYTAQLSAANAQGGDMLLTIASRTVWFTASEAVEVFAEILAVRVGGSDRLTGIDQVEPEKPSSTSFLLRGDIRTAWVHLRFTDRPGGPRTAWLFPTGGPRYNCVSPELASKEAVRVEWPLSANVALPPLTDQQREAGRTALAELIREKVGPDVVEGVVPGLGKFRVTRPEGRR